MADANMYILNPFFQTRSFDDMVKPLTMYALAYKEQEAKVEDMTDKAAALEWIANQNPESQTAALYRDMSAKIKGIRDDMMVNGLHGATRSRILGARKMYSANSAEITRRYEDMKKYQERMELLYDKDNSMIFSPESKNVSLDDFAGGKRPQIKAISGNEIMARGAAIGKRLTSLIFGDGVAGTEAGGLFWKLYKENGMTDEALGIALDSIGQGDKYALAKKVIDGVYGSFRDFDPVDQQKLKDRFIEGVYSGAVYAKDVDYKDNGEYMDPYKRALIKWGNDENTRANKEWNYKEKEYKILNGEPFQVGDKWYRYDLTDNKYHDIETGETKDAPTDIKGGTNKSKTKTKDKKPKPNNTVLAVDSDGNIVNVENNIPLGRPFYTTPEEQKEKAAAWEKIKSRHNGIFNYDIRYHLFKKEVDVKDTNGNVVGKKAIYYARPYKPDVDAAILRDSNTSSSSNTSSGSTTTGSQTTPRV